MRNGRQILWFAGCSFAALFGAAVAFAEPALYEPSTGDGGGIGLLQMPTARFGDDGYLSFGISRILPYDNLHLTAQPFPWLEGVFRYTDVNNRSYTASRTGQSYKDRGFDLKLRLWEEGDVLPQVAVGLRDFAGTGLFNSEYLVASRHIYAFDVSAGLAWGRLGSRGGVRNPLTYIANSFGHRSGQKGDPATGRPQYTKWFHGKEVALFGGVEWHAPVRGLSLKVEYDSNSYQDEPQDNDQPVDSPINFGVNYSIGDWVDLGAGWERGNEWMLRVAMRSNLHRDKGPPKILDAPLPAGSAPPAHDAASFTEAVRAGAARQNLGVQAVDYRPEEGRVHVWYGNGTYRNQAQAAGRIARVLNETAPPEVSSFALTNINGGLETFTAQLSRRDLEAALAYRGSQDELSARTTLTGTADRDGATHPQLIDFPEFGWGMSPALRQHIGGPDAFYFYQLWWRVSGRLQLSDGLSLSSSIGIDLHNNFDGLELRSFSRLPHVRSDIAEYLREGENNLVRLETNYVWSPAQDWYARLSAGIFEEMYGGAGSELLYRPYGRRWALGVDAARVRQRDYDQRFDFRDYEVTTGHLTLYYQPPWYNTLLRWSGGYYLAGDHGSTIDFSRLFDNGVRAGAFMTLTDVPSSQFGEGSFDKGFYFAIPLDVFFAKSSRRHAPFVFRPLTRDGGQKVRHGMELYPLLDGTDPGAISNGWDKFLD